jgi:hypothetical protein
MPPALASSDDIVLNPMPGAAPANNDDVVLNPMPAAKPAAGDDDIVLNPMPAPPATGGDDVVLNPISLPASTSQPQPQPGPQISLSQTIMPGLDAGTPAPDFSVSLPDTGLSDYFTRDLQARHESNQRILDAIKQGWTGTPDIMSPESRAALESPDNQTLKYLPGFGRFLISPALQALGGIVAGGNAAWQGLTQAGVEAAGGPDSLIGRDVGGLIESAGMTGAPHVPLGEPGYGRTVQDLRAEADKGIGGFVQPDVHYGFDPTTGKAGWYSGGDRPVGPEQPVAAPLGLPAPAPERPPVDLTPPGTVPPAPEVPSEIPSPSPVPAASTTTPPAPAETSSPAPGSAPVPEVVPQPTPPQPAPTPPSPPLTPTAPLPELAPAEPSEPSVTPSAAPSAEPAPAPAPTPVSEPPPTPAPAPAQTSEPPVAPEPAPAPPTPEPQPAVAAAPSTATVAPDTGVAAAAPAPAPAPPETPAPAAAPTAEPQPVPSAPPENAVPQDTPAADVKVNDHLQIGENTYQVTAATPAQDGGQVSLTLNRQDTGTQTTLDLAPQANVQRLGAETQTPDLSGTTGTTPATGIGSQAGRPIARLPGEQPRLDAIWTQLNKAQATVDRLEALGATITPRDAKALKVAQGTVTRLTKTRDELAVQKLPKGTKRPGAEKDFKDYTFNNGVPVYKQAFEDAGHDPSLAVNYPIERQNEILRKQIQDKFGFYNVAIDPKADRFAVRNQQLDQYRAMQDMMSSIGMPHDMASLQGRLRLQFEPPGKGKKYLAYYDPNYRTIAVTGRSNTFGHEWGHALDHYLMDHLAQQGSAKVKPYFTRYARNALLDPNDDMTARIAHVINTMFYDEGDLAAKRMQLQAQALHTNKQGLPTAGARAAQDQLDKLAAGASRMQIKSSQYRQMAYHMGDPDYWASELEMFARMNEAYVSRMIEQSGGDPRGVSMPDEAYTKLNDDRLKMAYPKDQELAANIAAFDHLYDGIRKVGLGGSIPGVMAKKGGISDPTYWSKLTTPDKKGAALVASLKDTWERLKHPIQSYRRTGLTDPSRPVSERAGWEGYKSIGRQLVYSKMGILEAIHHLAPEGAKAPVQEIMDKLGLSPGNRRYVGETFGERERSLSRQWVNQYAGILTHAGLPPGDLSALEGHMLHHVMTTGESTYPEDNGKRVPIPRNIQKAGGELQDLNGRILQASQAAGLEVGHVKGHGYWQRLYDHPRVYAEKDKFLTQAGKLHQLVFDQDMAEHTNNPAAHLAERFRNLTKEDKEQFPQSVRDAMKKLTTLTNRIDKLQDKIDDGTATPKEIQEHADKTQEAEALRLQHQDTVRDQIASIAATNWYARILAGYPGDYDTIGPAGSYINNRVLPPETDQIMRDFLDRDPNSAIPHYYMQAARKIAFAENFGHDQELFEDAMRKAVLNGLNDEDAKLWRSVFETITGRTNNFSMSGISKVSSAIHAGVATALMPRAVWSMMTEPLVGALATGDARVGLKSMLNQLGQVWRTGDGRARAELADFIGVTSSNIHDDIIMSRTGRDYSNTPSINKGMSAFYRMTGITQWNNSSRRASMGAMNWLIQTKYSKDILSNQTGAYWDKRRAEARGAFNELGVPPENQVAFAQWNVSRPKGIPRPQDLDPDKDPMAPVYSLAVRRLVDRAMQDPYKAERPMTAEYPWLGLTLQFMSFNYGFQRNVLDQMMARIGHAYRGGRSRAEEQGRGSFWQKAQGLGAGAKALLAASSLAAGYVAFGMGPAAMRQLAYSMDQWEKHEADGDLVDWIFGLAMSRSGLGGTIDPITQLATNLKYDSDLNHVLEGAGVNWYAHNGYDLLAPFLPGGPPSDSTNTRYHNAVRAAYNLFAVPFEAYIATRILGGFGTTGRIAGGTGLSYSTSPTAAEDFATWLTGPKGAKMPTGDEAVGATPEVGGAPGEGEAIGGEAPGAEGDGKTTGNAAATTGSVPWGLMDDVMMPLTKIAGPVWQAIPAALKYPVMALGALYYAAKAYDAMAPYRDQPPPEKKAP